MGTSKNLTLQSLLLTTTRGSTALSCEDVNRTELLMEAGPGRVPSNCHIGLHFDEDEEVVEGPEEVDDECGR